MEPGDWGADGYFGLKAFSNRTFDVKLEKGTYLVQRQDRFHLLAAFLVVFEDGTNVSVDVGGIAPVSLFRQLVETTEHPFNQLIGIMLLVIVEQLSKSPVIQVHKSLNHRIFIHGFRIFPKNTKNRKNLPFPWS